MCIYYSMYVRLCTQISVASGENTVTEDLNLEKY